jgi:hypothetical protein
MDLSVSDGPDKPPVPAADAPPPGAAVEDAARDAALEAWHRRSAPPADDEDEFVIPKRRFTFPPSFLAILAAGCAYIALDPTADLAYELLGPRQAVDLGRPAAYSMDKARDDQRVRISGYTTGVKVTFARWGDQFEVVPMVGVPVLVRRPPHAAPPPDTAELFEGEGRLILLEPAPASFLLRLFDPSLRHSVYRTVRLQFEALGEIPFGRPAWLLLVGDLPRTDLGAIATPLGLWVLSLAFAVFAWRSYVWRAAQPKRKRMRPHLL